MFHHRIDASHASRSNRREAQDEEVTSPPEVDPEAVDQEEADFLKEMEEAGRAMLMTKEKIQVTPGTVTGAMAGLKTNLQHPSTWLMLCQTCRTRIKMVDQATQYNLEETERSKRLKTKKWWVKDGVKMVSRATQVLIYPQRSPSEQSISNKGPCYQLIMSPGAETQQE